MALTDEVVVRVARRQDVPALVALLADDSLGKDRESAADLAAYLEAWDEMALDPNAEMLVLDVEGLVIGTATLTYARHLARMGMRRCTVESVRIAAAYRGQGLGRVLMDACVDMARARGCGVIQLTSDKRRTDAHRFYQRLGFEASHEGMKLYL